MTSSTGDTCRAAWGASKDDRRTSHQKEEAAVRVHFIEKVAFTQVMAKDPTQGFLLEKH